VTRVRLWWDFFGSESAGTAGHFARHLNEFLTRSELSYQPEVVPSEGATSVLLLVGAEHSSALYSALRPRRVEEAPEVAEETAS
jgi:hypothetical protein